MRITRFMLSLLVLRRLPGGGPLSLMFRLIAWGLIALGAANVLKKALSLAEPPAVSGPATGWALPSEPIRTTSIQAPEGVASTPTFPKSAGIEAQSGSEAAVAAVQDAIVEAKKQQEAAAAVAAVEQAITEAQEEVDAAIDAVEQAIADAQEQEDAAATVAAVEQAIADAQEQEKAATTVAAVEQAIAAAQEKEQAAVAPAARKRAKPASKAKRKASAAGEIPADRDDAASAYDPERDTVERPWMAAIDGRDCSEDFPIKAKASSMIFYGPQDGRYDRTHADVCFITEDAATEAGYRAPHTRKGSN